MDWSTATGDWPDMVIAVATSELSEVADIAHALRHGV